MPCNGRRFIQYRRPCPPEHMNEISTLTWPFVAAWAQSEIDRLRKQNDSVELGLEHTAAIRGEIRALKRLHDLPEAVARKNAAKSSAEASTWVIQNQGDLYG